MNNQYAMIGNTGCWHASANVETLIPFPVAQLNTVGSIEGNPSVTLLDTTFMGATGMGIQMNFDGYIAFTYYWRASASTSMPHEVIVRTDVGNGLWAKSTRASTNSDFSAWTIIREVSTGQILYPFYRHSISSIELCTTKIIISEVNDLF